METKLRAKDLRKEKSVQKRKKDLQNFKLSYKYKNDEKSNSTMLTNSSSNGLSVLLWSDLLESMNDFSWEESHHL